MNVIAIVVALGIEQWRTFRWRGALQQAFIRYARWLEHRFNGGSAQQGAIAGTLAIAPPVLIVAGGYWALDQISPLLGLAWNVLVLYLLVGFPLKRCLVNRFIHFGEFGILCCRWAWERERKNLFHDGFGPF